MKNQIIFIGRPDDGYRSDYDFPEGDTDLSREHARLEFKQDGKIFISSTKRTNGTWVNNKKYTESFSKEVFENDPIFFGSKQQERLDWKKVFSIIGKPPVIEPPIGDPPPGPEKPEENSNFKPWYLILPLSILLLGGAIWMNLKPSSHDPDPISKTFKTYTIQEVTDQYEKSVGMISVAYYIKVKMPNGQYGFIGPNKKVVDNSPNAENPILSDVEFVTLADRDQKIYPYLDYGTGILIEHNEQNSQQTNLITCRHLVNPLWDYSNTTESINNKQIDLISAKIQQTYTKANKPIPNIKYQIHYVHSQFYLNESPLTFPAQTTYKERLERSSQRGKSIDIFGWSKDENINLALGRVNDLSDKQLKLNYPEDFVTNWSTLKPNDPIYLIGYPSSSSLYDDFNSQLNAVRVPGYLSNNINHLNLDHNANSASRGFGSPIFTQKGKVCAIDESVTGTISAITVGDNIDKLLKRTSFEQNK